ncbi:MAG: hypothetical protein HYY18_10225 [Planctomycetes bacterium]|nr:hypothetical protein [Planctomycetota bacterium]
MRRLMWVLPLALLAGTAPAQGGGDTTEIRPWAQAVYGQDQAKMDGNAGVNAYAPGTPPSFTDDAVVRSNDLVRLEGNARIGGNAVSGGKVEQKGTKTEITGSIVEGADPLAFPALTDWIASKASANDNATAPATEKGNSAVKDGKLEVKAGDTLTLAEGDYYFTEVDIKGTLDVSSGTVRIFVSGSTDISGEVNPDGDPGDLWLLSSTTKSNGVKMAGTSTAWMAVYAMSGEVQVTGDAELFGAVTARTVQISGNGQVHYRPGMGDLLIEVDLETDDPTKKFK